MENAHTATMTRHATGRPQALYVVHPTALLRTWIFVLRLSEPDVYGKAIFCERLADLARHFPSGHSPQVPDHVSDHETSLLH